MRLIAHAQQSYFEKTCAADKNSKWQDNDDTLSKADVYSYSTWYDKIIIVQSVFSHRIVCVIFFGIIEDM